MSIIQALTHPILFSILFPLSSLSLSLPSLFHLTFVSLSIPNLFESLGMETAGDLVSRRLPHLYQVNGTLHPSVSRERVSARYLHEWNHFSQQVRDACASLDLTATVSPTDDTDDKRFIVGNELGLTGWFIQHVCNAVTKALSTTRLSHLCFGDIQSVTPTDIPMKVPDVAMISVSASLKLFVVGELKTFWTLPLELFAVNQTPASLINLEPHIDK